MSEVKDLEIYYAPLIPEAWRPYLEKQYVSLYSLLDKKEGSEKIEIYRAIEGFSKELKYNFLAFRKDKQEEKDKNFRELIDFETQDYERMEEMVDEKLEEYRRELDGEVMNILESYFFLSSVEKVPDDFIFLQKGRGVNIDSKSLAFKSKGEKYCKGIDLNMGGDWKTDFERGLINDFLDFSLEGGVDKGLRYLSDEVLKLKKGKINRENLLFRIKANRDPKTYSNRSRVRNRIKEILKRDLKPGEEEFLGCLAEKGIRGEGEFLESSEEIDVPFYIDKILSTRPG